MRLELLGLRARLGRFTLEVDATLEAPVTALFGPSGAGKTTLLELVAGLRRAEAGAIRLDGEALAERGAGLHRAPERRRLGYVPQDGALFPHLSVERNLRYGWRPEGEAAGPSFARVVAVLELEPHLGKGVGALSGGERRRVALGRALLASPRLLLLDEPLSGLDAALKRRVLPYLRAVREAFGTPMLYVSHDPDEVVALCDEVLLLEAGRVAARGTPTELFQPATEPRWELRPR
jgi:molybdate transport system ATP-binding protein